MRTSVMLLEKSTSKSDAPAGGSHCTSSTFMLGGSNVPSGGYTSVGAASVCAEQAVALEPGKGAQPSQGKFASTGVASSS